MKTITEICVANGASQKKLDNAEYGEIVIANAPQAAGFAVPVEFSEKLTNFASALSGNLNSEELQRFIAPHMRVPKHFEYATADRLDAFRRPSLAQMRRPRGGEYPVVGGTAKKEKASLEDFGLAVKIDKRDYSEDLARTWIARMKRMFTDALLEGSVAMLDAMAIETTISLSDLGEATLDRVVEDELFVASKFGGIRPNRILFGGQAWSMRKAYYESKALAGSTLRFPRTMQEMTQDIRADVRIMDAMSLTDVNTLDMLAGSTIYAYYGIDDPTTEDPSNMKTGVGADESVYHGQNEQGTLHVLSFGTDKKLLPVCAEGVVKITLTD